MWSTRGGQITSHTTTTVLPSLRSLKSDPDDPNTSSMDELETVEDSTAGITPVSNMIRVKAKSWYLQQACPNRGEAYSYNVQKE